MPLDVPRVKLETDESRKEYREWCEQLWHTPFGDRYQTFYDKGDYDYDEFESNQYEAEFCHRLRLKLE